MESIVQPLLEQFELERQLTFESVTAKTIHRLFHRTSGFTIVLFEMGDDPHDKSRMQRRKKVPYYDRDTFFPTVEDSLIAKLRWCARLNRAKDRDDIVKVLIHRHQSIDWAYLKDWAAQHSTAALLSDLMREAVPSSAQP